MEEERKQFHQFQNTERKELADRWAAYNEEKQNSDQDFVQRKRELERDRVTLENERSELASRKAEATRSLARREEDLKNKEVRSLNL